MLSAKLRIQAVTGSGDNGNQPNEQAVIAPDPRSTLASWANRQDEWVRFIVQQILSTGRPLAANDIDYAYDLFRQEKSFDERLLPAQAALEVDVQVDEAELPLSITKIAEVSGVNALVPGAVIEPHAGLTILYGENGTGKTGYSRIFKALADSRTADIILGDITAEVEQAPSARIGFTLGGEEQELVWTGQRGMRPSRACRYLIARRSTFMSTMISNTFTCLLSWPCSTM
ncbi:ATP-binding protein [Blastococcus brunescens]|uniref:ATP-binding protein n=1 Tax=Blastococcus brunescens TaxID=1564165 RepID=A0ABZ1B709_9ACTN|nr:ATP-binding protein [Blastococcus sp. BMG 8361]WRL65648.1 ATP-binding protein [Blastococcus sp. BMG 8361]